MINHPVVIQATYRRLPMVNYLLHHLPHAQVIYDEQRDYKGTFLRCLEANDAGHFHLEDDCTLGEGLKNIDDYLGDYMVQCFSRVKDDPIKGTRWLPGRAWMYNVCFWIPAGMSADIAEYAEKWTGWAEHESGFDTVIAAYLSETKRRFLNVVPALVQHTPIPSTLGARSKARQSKLFTAPILDRHPFPELLEPK